MKVKDVIAALQNVNPDANFFIHSFSDDLCAVDFLYTDEEGDVYVHETNSPLHDKRTVNKI
ncbi:hypothetical protein [Paenibacillus polymyxa]|uniref:hypothetical protein n=1 Tax=Paenibacillus polymyxa TaxID=1406 RepID=UPI00287F6D8B|nr:hypothetical protein [Paenibacillus polymyxa]